jgi:hypothetical protein
MTGPIGLYIGLAGVGAILRNSSPRLESLALIVVTNGLAELTGAALVAGSHQATSASLTRDFI